MENISRSEATAHRLPRYFTGEPCVRGHIAPRYTSSGACCQCMHERAGSATDVPTAPPVIPQSAIDCINAQRERERQRVDALGSLVEFKVWAHAEDVAEIRETAVALCLGEHACLDADDVRVTYGPTAIRGQLGHYRVRVPLKYVSFMCDMAQGLARKRASEREVRDREKSRNMLADIVRGATTKTV